MRKVILFVVACVAICGLAIASFFGYFVYQELAKPQWERDLNEARTLQKKDPVKAIALYKKICGDFEKQNIPETNAWHEYGNFLWNHYAFPDAFAVYKDGALYSQKIKLPENESWFLERQANCQHQMFRRGNSEKPDIKLIKRAIELHKDTKGKDAIWYGGRNLETLGDINLDLRDWKSADENYENALEKYRAEGDEEMAVEVINSKIWSLLEQGKYPEANKVFVRVMQDHSNSAYDISKEFRTKIINCDLRKAGLYPQFRELFAARDFAGLDKFADEARASKKSLPNGRWNIDAFHGEINSVERSEFEEVWLKHIATLKDWIKSNPKSATAKIALAHVLTSYAWKARGSGWANTVSDDGWKLMGERMDEAEAVIEQVKDRPPDWYAASQVVALGQSWSKEKYDQRVDECRQKYPDYDTVILTKTYWLQPRWHGEDGEAESYIEKEAKKRSAEDGDILYGRCAWWLERQIGDVFSETQLKWPRTKKGMLALKKRYPDSVMVPGEISMLALEDGDTATARTAFDK